MTDLYRPMLRLFGDHAEMLLRSLDSAYTAAGRAYHNLAHIKAMVENFRLYERQLANPDAVLLAILYHDFVYDSRAHGGENEEASARHVLSLTNLLRRPELAPLAADLIRATIHHRPYDDDSRWLLDFDLAIFVATLAEVLAYDDAIRVEYAWVDEETYRRERGGVLRRFRQRDAIYFTPPFQIRDAEARANLDALIARYPD
jgi:predicted metal-dependent HD superfamily phosphohydrolase